MLVKQSCDFLFTEKEGPLIATGLDIGVSNLNVSRYFSDGSSLFVIRGAVIVSAVMSC